MRAAFVRGVEGLPREQWDALDGGGCPFGEWAYLAACEEASAVPRHGSLPNHLTLWDGERLVAAAPLYLKADGRAEFIYDYYWYHFAHQAGFDYYPKLVSMCPFAPVTTPHFRVHPDYPRAELLPMMVELIEAWAAEHEVHGIHFLFVPEDEAALLEGLGYAKRISFQLALHNAGWRTFDDYLTRFRSRRRVAIRRERRRPAEQGLVIEIREGNEIEQADIEAMYAFYSLTCAAYGTGSHYLKAPTWTRLWRDWRDRLTLVLARDARGKPQAGALLVQGGGELYGRYWGAVRELPSLYFNVAYYRPIEHLIERGLARFHCGFGNAHYKHARGFDPLVNLSLHKLTDPRLHRAIAASLEEERPEVLAQIAARIR